ncbi:alcohol dehydrogenase [Mycobacterium antarcticum]|uniref:NADPH:quinone oxidoreductase family protein n=1 Tax=unclassified Mycolicibacterium TaxID=2636767 RepID=UPI00239B8E89|nr:MULTISPECIES: NADPH:quinone oxidoreductase family protein [unclassified Mycolicibacterium]BDX29563.1 alcohol dehydrogenase [Mycolicibacterium sp. TUM20985]GLP72994.1 alcohol dehydrogenase [Mycolicibacterium sp. TUM20983]GLP78709.1 alcohol dehydrogenase [Mycolicibacterium sp. TUM20984]
MKALVAQELSGPAGLVYTDVPDPAEQAGDGMVVVDVGAAGVSFPDLLLIKGEYQLKLDPPFVPGTEVAGVVRSAPADSGFVVGQRVSALTMLGAWAERVALPVTSVTPTPDGVDDGSAVALLGNYYTMYFALVRRAALLAGETVLVLGSAGGVGTAAVQVAKALGARVIAMVHRTGAMEFVNSLGADAVLPLTPGWAQAVRDLTDGRGVDVVVDPVGGSVFDDAVRVLATEGRLLVLGFASGGGIPTVKVNRLLLRNVSVVGVGLGEFLNRVPEARAEIGLGLGKLVDAGLRPPPPVRRPLSEGRAALESLASGGVRGKLVLEP